MIAMVIKKQENDVNNWLRWSIGVGVTILIALTVHIGNEGSRLKKEMADMQSIEATHTEGLRRTDLKIDRIEDKIDKLIERK